MIKEYMIDLCPRVMQRLSDCVGIAQLRARSYAHCRGFDSSILAVVEVVVSLRDELLFWLSADKAIPPSDGIG